MSSFDVTYDTPIQIQQVQPNGHQIMVVGTAGTLEVDGALTMGTGSSAGFFGSTAVTQPTSANEAAVGTLPSSFTWNGSSVYPSSADATAIVNAFAALKTLVNQLRADLVTLGLIKGS